MDTSRFDGINKILYNNIDKEKLNADQFITVCLKAIDRLGIFLDRQEKIDKLVRHIAQLQNDIAQKRELLKTKQVELEVIQDEIERLKERKKCLLYETLKQL